MPTKSYVRETDGGWEVLQEGHRRATARGETQKQAVERARAIVRSSGGGEVRVLNQAGKVVSSKKVGRRRSGTSRS